MGLSRGCLAFTAMGAAALVACAGGSPEAVGTDGGAPNPEAAAGEAALGGDSPSLEEASSDARPPGDAGLQDTTGLEAASADACVDDLDAAVAQCDETFNVPPSNLPGWTPVLSRTGSMTLTHDTGHLHDDGLGALGFCPAVVACGHKYLGLVSARFETDQQDQNFTTSQHCITDYTQPDPTLMQYGMCYSGGGVAIYVEVRDETGVRLAQGDGFDVFIAGMNLPVTDLHDKPPLEFPMNFPMSGHGGQRYGVRATYTDPVDGPLPSDAVTNMRLALNHHVNYLLTFQVKRR